MRLLALLLYSMVVIFGADGTRSSCCPPDEMISPCVCSVDSNSMMASLDCSAVEDDNQLIQILQAQLPCKNFKSLQIWDNYNVKRLSADTFRDVTFEAISFFIGGLETIEDDAFSTMAETLQLLSLDSQKLATFPFHMIQELKNFTVLDLTFNKLHDFPESLVSDTLEVLTLAENPLKQLPENPFNLLPKLQAIDLGITQLKSLPKDLFINNPDIADVMLRGNNIRNLTKNTFSFSSNKMEWLELRWNIVEFLEEGTFDGMEGWEGYTKPAYIDLWDNRITTLDENLWRPLFEKEVNILLEANELECGCDVAWYVNMEEFHHLVHDAVCVSGEYLNGLDPGQFTDC